MARVFRRPSFGDRQIELRLEEGEICIYATDAGLRRLIAFCKLLLDDPQQGHIHLEDYEVLTQESLNGALAVFTPGSGSGE
jgi:hypothetical protein